MASERALVRCSICPSRGINVYSVLDSPSLRVLESATGFGHRARGQVLFREGSPLDHLYCIRSGSVKLYKCTTGGERYTLRIAGPGDVLGLESLLSRTPANATAEMLEEGVVCSTERDAVFSLFPRQPDFARGVMELLAAQLHRSDEERLRLSRDPVRKQLARLLLVLARSHGAAHGSGILIEFDLSQGDLSEMLGTARETVVRALSRMRRERVIGSVARRILVSDVGRLEGIAEIS